MWRLMLSPVRSAARSWCVLLTAAAVAVAGCAQAPETSAETTSATGSATDAETVADDGAGQDGSWEFPECDDVPRLSAPADAYRDKPVYVADEGPFEEILAWAEAQPGYETTWIDRDRFGTISVGFARGADARQRDLEEKFAGAGVVAVPIEHTEAELDALAKRVSWELAPLLAESHGAGAWVSVSKGVVTLSVPGLTDEIRDEITKRFSGEPLCVDDVEPVTIPPPGPQPQEGEGWRLLADEKGIGPLWRVGLAADAAGLAELWAEIGLAAPVPEVNFDEHVVVSFGAVYSGSCPDIRLDDVVVDGAVVYPEIVKLDPLAICDLGAAPHAYVVVLQRSLLPPGPFVVQLEAELPEYAQPEQRLRVDADLSKPGAVPDPAAARHERDLSKPMGPRNVGVSPGDPWPYLVDTRCGIEWLGEVNGYAWRTDEAMPEEWERMVEADGLVEVTITLRVDPEPLIEVELNNKTVVYKLTDEEIPKCEQP